MMRHVPLWRKGEHTLKAPLHCSDMASGIMACLQDPNALGATYEFYGPQQFLLSELVDWMHYKSGRDYDWGYRRTDLRFSPLPFIKAFVNQNLPLGTRFFGRATLDKLERVSESGCGKGDTPPGSG